MVISSGRSSVKRKPKIRYKEDLKLSWRRTEDVDKSEKRPVVDKTTLKGSNQIQGRE